MDSPRKTKQARRKQERESALYGFPAQDEAGEFLTNKNSFGNLIVVCFKKTEAVWTSSGLEENCSGSSAALPKYVWSKSDVG